jgi:hypothetical protein
MNIILFRNPLKIQKKKFNSLKPFVIFLSQIKPDIFIIE